MKLSALAFGLSAAVGSSVSAAADYIANGGFEEPTVAANTFQHVTPDSWVWGRSQGVVFNGLVLDPPSGIFWPQAHSGKQFVDIGNVSSFTLTQTFAIPTSGAFIVSWWANAHKTANSSPYSAQLRDASGSTLMGVSTNAASGGTWQQQSHLVQLHAGSFTLTFTALGVPGGYDTLLDDVSVSTAVPEPQVWIMLATAPLLLIAASRRARQTPRAR